MDAVCKRRLPADHLNNYAILVKANALANQDLKCFFPAWNIVAGTSVQAEFKLVYGETTPEERFSWTVSTKYWSRFRVTSNTLSFSGSTPNMNSSYVKSFSSS